MSHTSTSATYKFILFFGVCLPAFAAAQASDPLVSYTTHCVPLERAVEDISKAVSKPLKVHPSLAKEPIALRLVKVPLKEVQVKIADTISAE